MVGGCLRIGQVRIPIGSGSLRIDTESIAIRARGLLIPTEGIKNAAEVLLSVSPEHRVNQKITHHIIKKA
jgi:hypothetical protein